MRNYKSIWYTILIIALLLLVLPVLALLLLSK